MGKVEGREESGVTVRIGLSRGGRSMKSIVRRTGPPEPTIADVFDELKAIRGQLDKLATQVEEVKNSLPRNLNGERNEH